MGVPDPVIIGGLSAMLVDDAPTVVIYTISASEFSLPVYVGSTLQQLRNRVRAHILDANKGSGLPIHAWMREHKSFFATVVDRGPLSARRELEKQWVSRFDGLLNMTDGGPGMSGHLFAGTPHAARIAAKIRTGVTKVCESCGSSFYRKLSESVKGNDRFCSRQCYQVWQVGSTKKRAAA